MASAGTGSEKPSDLLEAIPLGSEAARTGLTTSSEAEIHPSFPATHGGKGVAGDRLSLSTH